MNFSFETVSATNKPDRTPLERYIANIKTICMLLHGVEYEYEAQ